MVYASNELFQSSDGVGSGLRAFPTSVQPKTFASGSGTLARLTPVAFNTSTNMWQVWKGYTNEINTITAHGTPATDGTFTLTVNGQTTAAIDHDATPAVIQAALEALSNVAVGDVVASIAGGTDLGDASAIVTLTWGGLLAGTDITITANFGGLTGNAHVLATGTAGGAAEVNGTDAIQGFVWPDPITLDASGEVVGNVMLGGRVHYADIPLVAGSYSQVELAAGLRTQGLRSKGFILEGLSQFR